MSKYDDDVARSHDMLINIALRLCHNTYDAEDLVQDTIEKMLINGDKYDDTKSLMTWAVTIMKNTFVTNIRHIRRIEMRDLDEDTCRESHMRAGDHIGFHEVCSAVRRCLRRSCGIECVILYAKGYTYDEIAELRNIPVGTVKSRIANGRILIRQALGIS